MKKHKLSEVEHKTLLVQPQVFQPDDVVNPGQFHFRHTMSFYQDYIEEQECMAKDDNKQCQLYNSEKNLFLWVLDLFKYGYRGCSGCHKLIVECHDMVFVFVSTRAYILDFL